MNLSRPAYARATLIKDAKRHYKPYDFSKLDKNAWPRTMRDLVRALEASRRLINDLHDALPHVDELYAANADRPNTGATNDDRTDIACWIGRDLIPNLGDALTAAERLLASKWLAETIAGAKADALIDAAEALGADRREGSTFTQVLPIASANRASRRAEQWLRARAAEYPTKATS